MTPLSWLILAFAVLMTAVCGFTFVQILRSGHQAQQRSSHKARRNLSRH
ncbi:hypothetical protein [Salinicola sp. DM10]|nr:hypothetical protein [Salinicola sp. DM10]MCE3028962.1 hypothetical protein [Salinicola sp. DM10]